MPIIHSPFLPQWGAGADRYRNDCGPACVAMLLALYSKLGALTVDQLSAETGLRTSDVGLMPDALVRLAARHRVLLRAYYAVRLDAIREEIDAFRPVIALVAYRYITGRLDQADNVPGNDGHYILLTGYDDTHVVANDPDYWRPEVERGHEVLIPVAEIERALFPYGSVCLFLEYVPMSDQIIALAKQIEAIAAQIGTPAPPPPPAPEPIPDGSILVKVKSGVNVRTEASATSAIFLQGGLGAGVEIVVNSATISGGLYYKDGVAYHSWRKITARLGRGGYVAEAFLDFQ